MHVSLSPTWSETAWFADYILPMGLGTERHDTMSQETHAGQWLGFRQPVLRVAREKKGEPQTLTHESNPGEVWEESEFWVALSWKIDPDGALGIRKFFESPYRPGEKITMDDYYGWMFENSVPGLPEKAAKENLTPLQYMRKYGVFQVSDKSYSRGHERPLTADEQARGVASVLVDGVPRAGFNTPSRKLEFYSPTLAAWGWPEHAVPRYVPGHVHWRDMKREEGEFDLLPNFRLPTLIHTRSAVKWLYEISHSNPLWISTKDARQYGIKTGDLVKLRDADRIFRDAGVGDGGHPAGRARDVASPRPVAPEGRDRRRADGDCSGVDRAARKRPVSDAPGTRRAPVRQQRPRQPAHLVERDRRAPEPDVPGPARPGQRDALLAPACPP
jgi:anaerobic selenocysteine-containing dehydrogenase